MKHLFFIFFLLSLIFLAFGQEDYRVHVNQSGSVDLDTVAEVTVTAGFKAAENDAINYDVTVGTITLANVRADATVTFALAGVTGFTWSDSIGFLFSNASDSIMTANYDVSRIRGAITLWVMPDSVAADTLRLPYRLKGQ